jgi:nucleoside-diphosphate-sugar epimerase
MILGGDGLIGSALSKFLKQNNHHVVTTTRNKNLLNSSTYYLNFKNLEGLSLLPMVDIVFICAAISTKKESAQNKELALQVNVLAPKIITDFFISNNARVIFI